MASAKVRMKVGEAWIEVDAMSVKDALEGLCEYAEVFAQGMCGLCQSTNVTPQHRRDKDGHHYYSMNCLDCHAQLGFGQTREGERLFPRRKDQDGNPIGKHGWFQWQNTQTDPGEF